MSWHYCTYLFLLQKSNHLPLSMLLRHQLQYRKYHLFSRLFSIFSIVIFSLPNYLCTYLAICRLQIISIFSFYIKKKEFKQSSIPNINHNENEIWFQLWCISLYDLLESRAFKKNSPCQKIDVVWDIVHLFWYSCSSMCKYQDLVLSFIVPSSTDNIKGSIISEKALYRCIDEHSRY